MHVGNSYPQKLARVPMKQAPDDIALVDIIA